VVGWKHLKNLLDILETALWVFIAFFLLLLVLGLLIVNLPGWLSAHPRYPADCFWYITWGIIGAVVLSLVWLWWWWGRVLKDRETARHIVESMGDEKSGGEFPG
jgi:hypothetical protein